MYTTSPGWRPDVGRVGVLFPEVIIHTVFQEVSKDGKQTKTNSEITHTVVSEADEGEN